MTLSNPRHFHAFVGGVEVVIEPTSDRRVVLSEPDDAVRGANASEVRKVVNRATQHFDELAELLGESTWLKMRARADVTDAEIDAALARGKAFEQYAPRAVKAVFRWKDDAVVTLSTGVELAIPRRLL